MPIVSDCHMHTWHSGDSETPMEEMILEGISMGLSAMCFTEHNDFEWPISEIDPKGKYECNADLYFKEFCECQEKICRQDKTSFWDRVGITAFCGRSK